MGKVRIKALFLVLSVMVVLIGCSGNSAGSNEDVYELSFNIQSNTTHPFYTEAIEPWAKFVEEETDGKVKITVYSSSALGTLDTAYEDIKGGVYDIGYVSPMTNIDTDLFPLSIGDLPFAFTDSLDVMKVMEKYRDTFLTEMSDQAVWMTISSTDAYQIYSNEPIETMEDLKNKKFRTEGPYNIDLVKGWNSVPVSINYVEMYEAMEKGTVDLTEYTSIGALGFKLEEVSKHLTKIDKNVAQLLFLMNGNAFNKLPEDIQKKFEEVLNPKLGELIGQLYHTKSADSIKTFEEKVKDKGGSVIVPTEEELKEFKKPSKAIWDKWVEEADERGYQGQEMMDYFLETIEEEGISKPF